MEPFTLLLHFGAVGKKSFKTTNTFPRAVVG